MESAFPRSNDVTAPRTWVRGAHGGPASRAHLRGDPCPAERRPTQRVTARVGRGRSLGTGRREPSAFQPPRGGSVRGLRPALAVSRRAGPPEIGRRRAPPGDGFSPPAAAQGGRRWAVGPPCATPPVGSQAASTATPPLPAGFLAQAFESLPSACGHAGRGQWRAQPLDLWRQEMIIYRPIAPLAVDDGGLRSALKAMAWTALLGAPPVKETRPVRDAPAVTEEPEPRLCAGRRAVRRR